MKGILRLYKGRTGEILRPLKVFATMPCARAFVSCRGSLFLQLHRGQQGIILATGGEKRFGTQRGWELTTKGRALLNVREDDQKAGHFDSWVVC